MGISGLFCVAATVTLLAASHASSTSSSTRSCTGATQPLSFPPSSLPFHLTGAAWPAIPGAWEANVSSARQTYLTYGPYTGNVSGAPQVVSFGLLIDNNVHDDTIVAVVDVFDGSRVLATREIHRRDFANANAKQDFDLFFTNTPCSRRLEFRVFYVCCARVIHASTLVRPLDPGPFDAWFRGPGGSSQNRTAHLELISTSSFDTAGKPGTAFANVGEDFVVDPAIPGKLWVFYREMDFKVQPKFCDGILAPFRIVARSTTDEGRTWSDEFVIAEPSSSPDDGFTNCALVDGAAFFDRDTATWHYLSQCIGTARKWGMCEYSLRGHQDPTAGTWTANAHNPVVKGGQLFSEICSGPGKHCSPKTVDEGTPDIVEKRNGQFFVTFHGYDYGAKKSARGVASTPDFVHWNTCSFNLPCDAIFSSTDCDPWKIDWAKGGCVGGGQASILKSGDYLYELIEAPDVSLACLTKAGEQNWVYGWLRSPSFQSPSGSWEQWHDNPAVVPFVHRGCTLQYNRQWESQGSIYVAYYVLDFATGKPELQIWKLVPGDLTTGLPVVARMY
jgi:hypothetical protein